MAVKNFIVALFLFISPFLLFSQQEKEAQENEEKIESLKDQLLELDLLLNKYKMQEAEQKAILDDAELDDETKSYIKQVVEDYTKSATTNDAEIGYIKGQLDLMRRSLDDLRTDVAKGSTETDIRIDQIDSKMNQISQSSDPAELTALRAEVASLKARIKLMEEDSDDDDGDESDSESGGYKNELIAQQQKEIEILKEEVNRLKTELKTAQQQVRFVNSEELQKLKDQNQVYKQTIDRQQRELALLMEKVDLLKTQVDREDEFKELAERIEKLAERTEEVEREKFQAENQTSIAETVKDLDILAFRNKSDQRIDELSKDVDELKSLVVSGKVIENTNDPMFFSNTTGSYYVIVASRRSEEAIKLAQEDLLKQGYKTEIMQNERKSWYHLTPQRLETRKEAGEAVTELRAKGFKGAWWLYHKSENN